MLTAIQYTARFRGHYIKADKKIRNAFVSTLELFLEDPLHPILRNHALRDIYTGYRSIDITDDWRAIYKEIRIGKMIVISFSALGTHKQLYG